MTKRSEMANWINHLTCTSCYFTKFHLHFQPVSVCVTLTSFFPLCLSLGRERKPTFAASRASFGGPLLLLLPLSSTPHGTYRGERAGDDESSSKRSAWEGPPLPPSRNKQAPLFSIALELWTWALKVASLLSKKKKEWCTVANESTQRSSINSRIYDYRAAAKGTINKSEKERGKESIMWSVKDRQ